MRHNEQPYTNVPELREQLMEVWYEQEWGNHADSSIVTKAWQSLKPLLQPVGIVSRLLRPANLKTVAPDQMLNTETAR